MKKNELTLKCLQNMRRKEYLGFRIQDICNFTSRVIGYYPFLKFYFQGYGILCSITWILFKTNTEYKAKQSPESGKKERFFSGFLENSQYIVGIFGHPKRMLDG